MNDTIMREKIDQVLDKMESKKRKLLLLGASCALAASASCFYPVDKYGVALYGIEVEDAGIQEDGGDADSSTTNDR